jgi:hypothetical protein
MLSSNTLDGTKSEVFVCVSLLLGCANQRQKVAAKFPTFTGRSVFANSYCLHTRRLANWRLP